MARHHILDVYILLVTPGVDLINLSRTPELDVELRNRMRMVYGLWSNGNCTRGPNLGASLRRPNWPCPESLLIFHKLFSKSDPAYLRDAISA